ncbi:MAG: hypothetical protein RL757_1129 [Bacteroidota bacterium]
MQSKNAPPQYKNVFILGGKHFYKKIHIISTKFNSDNYVTFMIDFCVIKNQLINLLYMSKKIFFLFLMFATRLSNAGAQNDADKIVGKWMSADNDMKVEVYKNNGYYEGRIIWFACAPKYVMTDFYDKKNPNKSLCGRPWLGMNVLEGLQFKKKNEWHNGKIYDPNSGGTYSSVCRLEGDHTLKVKGFWMYEWIGKSLVFYRTQ